MKYGCIGETLKHSFSKEIHTQLFGYEYELCEVKREELDAFMSEKAFSAINVTIPYKQQVIKHLDYISPVAEKIGAVNTVVNKDGKLYGYNTDFYGMLALIKKAQIDVKGKKVLVLGSGGTSKTAVAVAQELEADEVYRVSRTGRDGCITYEDARTLHSDAQIIINTTPCGMYPNNHSAPIDLGDYKQVEGVVDAVYNPLRSKLICDALRRGVNAVGGLYMLVAQAAFAAEKFVEKKVKAEKIDKIYQNLLASKQNIVLIGMPGCGKSTVGKQLAEVLDMDFVDTDTLIEQTAQKTISQIFEDSGETSFREIESEIIFDIAKTQSKVIATGGGAVLRSINTDALKQNGKLYFLDRPLSDLVTTDDRPLSSNRNDLEKRYNERYDIYCSSCDVHVEASGSVSDVVKIIKEDFNNENTCD